MANTACTTTYKVTGRVVAVRRPAWNDGPAAKPNSPVDHYAHRGDALVSCINAIALQGIDVAVQVREPDRQLIKAKSEITR
ncbi:hypothetical protein OHB05_42650 [Streptomyces sp. NBC_00638]|uniref:hypothetical protein n=1 Tax=Streptomyces sp. NBC_00638 TaxID=2975794 RepID=UPI00224FC973|nr:hypothetical protein [Streptomyces sp. NBC_00638]MCX5009218.1 hypothetical protein [Streptomyces sp. NBC_00638]